MVSCEMSIHKLERVMWRLRKRNPDEKRPTNTELQRAIMYEVGTSPACYQQNRKALIKLGWIRTFNSKRIEITDNDITGD